MKKVLLLVDSRGYLTSSLIEQEKMVDIDLIRQLFKKRGYLVEVKNLHNLKFPTNYKGWYVLYPSSEDIGLFYKDFIEDIILRLSLDGAILLPRFECFRAHHNKVFMELLRTHMKGDDFQTVHSSVCYSYEILKKTVSDEISYPAVVKTAAGAGSIGVALANDETELGKIVSRMGKVSYTNMIFSAKRKVRVILGTIKRKVLKIYIPPKVAKREKTVIQSFIPNLQCDYKVLVFGEKFYILRRKVRENDFRASGSGKLEFPEYMTKKEYQVLDLAKKAYEELDNPLLSIDIAHDGEKCHMIEFQCLNFGPYTLQYSSCYYQYINGSWHEIREKSILEHEIVEAVNYHIERHKGKTNGENSIS